MHDASHRLRRLYGLGGLGDVPLATSWNPGVAQTPGPSAAVAQTVQTQAALTYGGVDCPCAVGAVLAAVAVRAEVVGQRTGNFNLDVPPEMLQSMCAELGVATFIQQASAEAVSRGWGTINFRACGADRAAQTTGTRFQEIIDQVTGGGAWYKQPKYWLMGAGALLAGAVAWKALK